MFLSFSTTAMARPEILQRTYESFQKHLHINFKKYTLYLNVDPLPDANKTHETIKVAQSFFGDVVHRVPTKANFTAAVQWCWSTANSKYLFHLEDDWILIDDVPLAKLMRLLGSDTMMIAIRAYNFVYDKTPLSPGIWHRSLYKKVVFDTSINPEIQLRDYEQYGIEFSIKKNFKVYPKKRILIDIGRQWMKSQKYQKPKGKAFFISWVPK